MVERIPKEKRSGSGLTVCGKSRAPAPLRRSVKKENMTLTKEETAICSVFGTDPRKYAEARDRAAAGKRGAGDISPSQELVIPSAFGHSASDYIRRKGEQMTAHAARESLPIEEETTVAEIAAMARDAIETFLQAPEDTKLLERANMLLAEALNPNRQIGDSRDASGGRQTFGSRERRTFEEFHRERTRKRQGRAVIAAADPAPASRRTFAVRFDAVRL